MASYESGPTQILYQKQIALDARKSSNYLFSSQTAPPNARDGNGVGGGGGGGDAICVNGVNRKGLTPAEMRAWSNYKNKEKFDGANYVEPKPDPPKGKPPKFQGRTGVLDFEYLA